MQNHVRHRNASSTAALSRARRDSVVKELAQRLPKLLFLEIEAEDLPDISETFDVESVPHFVILRGHTLLQQVSGADAVQLTKAVEKHSGSKPAAQALSTTNQAPQKAAARPAGATDDEEEAEYAQDPAPASETAEELDARCQKIMNSVGVLCRTLNSG
jgi:hypothetical protein